VFWPHVPTTSATLVDMTSLSSIICRSACAIEAPLSHAILCDGSQSQRSSPHLNHRDLLAHLPATVNISSISFDASLNPNPRLPDACDVVCRAFRASCSTLRNRNLLFPTLAPPCGTDLIVCRRVLFLLRLSFDTVLLPSTPLPCILFPYFRSYRDRMARLPYCSTMSPLFRFRTPIRSSRDVSAVPWSSAMFPGFSPVV